MTTDTNMEIITKPKVDSCECLEKIRKSLREAHGVEVDLHLKMAINMKTMEMNPELPPLVYSYRDKKGKRKQTYLMFNFCPFCGRAM